MGGHSFMVVLQVHRVAVQNYRIGYAAGDELMPYLRWRRLPLGPAVRVGLLTHAGREFLAGRIVVPELRDGHPVWLFGRILEQVQVTQADENTAELPPKYLALRGSKRLLGWEQARGSATVIAVEGVVDLLTLRTWGFPAVALVDALGPNTVPVALPEGVKDVAKLAPRPDGQDLLAAALLEAVGASRPEAPSRMDDVR